ncbi:hypothetical protein TGMAS_218490A [Toxoplasma gondii MAS]|uniref:Uncharacterized protein n=1 Tax=Toxoplasma gondii MAS TaxID=943118 RepID=A0A086QT98_TOXGO|nr:hypothetical protein TGMAS_218490A [Toxoplasma gondii MAS]
MSISVFPKRSLESRAGFLLVTLARHAAQNRKAAAVRLACRLRRWRRTQTGLSRCETSPLPLFEPKWRGNSAVSGAAAPEFPLSVALRISSCRLSPSRQSPLPFSSETFLPGNGGVDSSPEAYAFRAREHRERSAVERSPGADRAKASDKELHSKDSRRSRDTKREKREKRKIPEDLPPYWLDAVALPQQLSKLLKVFRHQPRDRPLPSRLLFPRVLPLLDLYRQLSRQAQVSLEDEPAAIRGASWAHIGLERMPPKLASSEFTDSLPVLPSQSLTDGEATRKTASPRQQEEAAETPASVAKAEVEKGALPLPPGEDRARQGPASGGREAENDKMRTERATQDTSDDVTRTEERPRDRRGETEISAKTREQPERPDNDVKAQRIGRGAGEHMRDQLRALRSLWRRLVWQFVLKRQRLTGGDLHFLASALAKYKHYDPLLLSLLLHRALKTSNDMAFHDLAGLIGCCARMGLLTEPRTPSGTASSPTSPSLSSSPPLSPLALCPLSLGVEGFLARLLASEDNDFLSISELEKREEIKSEAPSVAQLGGTNEVCTFEDRVWREQADQAHRETAETDLERKGSRHFLREREGADPLEVGCDEERRENVFHTRETELSEERELLGERVISERPATSGETERARDASRSAPLSFSVEGVGASAYPSLPSGRREDNKLERTRARKPASLTAPELARSKATHEPPSWTSSLQSPAPRPFGPSVFLESSSSSEGLESEQESYDRVYAQLQTLARRLLKLAAERLPFELMQGTAAGQDIGFLW